MRTGPDGHPGVVTAFVHRLEIELPTWLVERLHRPVIVLDGTDRMRYAVELAAENVERATGGPFGAAVFEMASGRLVGAGVNLVTSAGNSTAHAEMLALALAEQVVGSYDLGAAGLPAHELVTSAEPCVMCLGALVWSGVRRVVCGARDEDARRIGFDEGPKPSDWVDALERRGIEVVRDVLRAESSDVLDGYASAGHPIYNPRRD